MSNWRECWCEKVFAYSSSSLPVGFAAGRSLDANHQCRVVVEHAYRKVVAEVEEPDSRGSIFGSLLPNLQVLAAAYSEAHGGRYFVGSHDQEVIDQLGRTRTRVPRDLHLAQKIGSPVREIVERSVGLVGVCGQPCYAFGSSAKHSTDHTYHPPSCWSVNGCVGDCSRESSISKANYLCTV